MANGKTYELRSVEDFIKVVNTENVAVLSEDFSQFLASVAGMKKMTEETENLSLEYAKFIWKDDGEVGCTGVNIEFTKK